MLITRLSDVFANAEHVRNVGLKSGDDISIWQFAKESGFVIVTKDDDFKQLAVVHGHPPKVIWLTLGNCTTERIERVLRDRHAQLIAFNNDPEQSLVTLSI